MNQIHIFARKCKTETVTDVTTQSLIRDNHINASEKVIECWEAKEKYDLTYLHDDGKYKYEEPIVLFYETDTGNIVVMTDIVLEQRNEFHYCNFADFINRIKVSEIRVVYKGSEFS